MKAERIQMFGSCLNTKEKRLTFQGKMLVFHMQDKFFLCQK